MKTRPNISNATFTRDLTVTFDVKNLQNYWKNRLKIVQGYFFIVKEPSEIKFGKVLNSGKVCSQK